MQGWTTPFFVLPVSAWLDSRFTGGCIGRRRPSQLLSRSASLFYRMGQSGSLRPRTRTLDELE